LPHLLIDGAALNFIWTNPPFFLSPEPMANSEPKLVTRGSLIFDAVLLVAFFIFFFQILKSHVPATTPLWLDIGSAYATSCLTGVFWLALQMFRVVLRFHRESKK
jgi:hypothetical protein